MSGRNLELVRLDGYYGGRPQGRKVLFTAFYGVLGMRNIAWGFVYLSMLSALGCAKSESVEIIAHRGASYLAPENTLAAVQLGWEKQADVEVDVYLSKDNRIVVMHDSTTKRTAGGVDLKLSETDSQELRKLDVGSFKAPEFAGERIPYLEEVLATIPPGRKLFVEIKCKKEILPILEPMIAASGKKSQIVIICFDLEVAAEAKKLIGVPTYWLKGTDKVKDTDQWIPHDSSLIQTARDRGLDGLDVHYAGVTAEFAGAVRDAGQKLYVWTVDDPNEAARLVALNVDGITTNRPGWLREQLKDRKAIP
jgi:glycerophosphoryl diester phosphodiesterase